FRPGLSSRFRRPGGHWLHDGRVLGGQPRRGPSVPAPLLPARRPVGPPLGDLRLGAAGFLPGEEDGLHTRTGGGRAPRWLTAPSLWAAGRLPLRWHFDVPTRECQKRRPVRPGRVAARVLAEGDVAVDQRGLVWRELAGP